MRISNERQLHIKCSVPWRSASEFDSAKLCFNMHHATVLMSPGLTESSTIKSESMSLC